MSSFTRKSIHSQVIYINLSWAQIWVPDGGQARISGVGVFWACGGGETGSSRSCPTMWPNFLSSICHLGLSMCREQSAEVHCFKPSFSLPWLYYTYSTTDSICDCTHQRTPIEVSLKTEPSSVLRGIWKKEQDKDLRLTRNKAGLGLGFKICFCYTMGAWLWTSYLAFTL